MDIPMLLEIPAAIVPDRTAVADDERSLTYGELAASANAVAERRVAAGVEPGAHVIVLGVNTVGFVAALFGIAAAGCVAVPVNYRVREDELTYLLQDSGAAAVLTQPRYRELAEAAGADLVLDLEEASTPAADADGELHRLRDLDYDAVAVILYTSGTTAAPKGVMLGHAGLAQYVMLGRDAPDGSDAGSSVLAAPLYHVAGITALLNALYVGRTTYLMPRFEPADWLDLVEARAVTHAFVVPTMRARIIDDEAFGLSAPELGQALKREGIDTRRYYWPPIHMQKAYADSPRERDLPITERVAGSVLTPPLYSHMTEDEARRVARSIAAVQANASLVRSALG